MTSHHLIKMYLHGKQQVQQGYRIHQIHIFRFVMADRPFLSIRTPFFQDLYSALLFCLLSISLDYSSPLLAGISS